MASGYIIPINPAELANRFSTSDDPYEETEAEREALLLEEEIQEFAKTMANQENAERVSELLNKIPPREADLIELYYMQQKRQADIAEIFGVTQAAISYRLARGVYRIKFLLSIPDVKEEDMRRDLELIFKKIDIDILVGMWLTTCQSVVADNLGLTQGRVRHRFFKAVEALAKAGAENVVLEPYSRIFSKIADKNFNALRSVVLPQWSSRGNDECL